MADALAREVLHNCEQLEADAQTYIPTWQEITDYMLPGRRNFLGQPLFGDRGTQKLFDGTAISASNLLAASIHGSVSSPDTYWARLLAQDDYINEIRTCAEWLDDTTRRMHWHFAQSNLYGEIGESYIEDIVYGTGNLYMCEKDETAPRFSGFRFVAAPVGQYVMAENQDGIVDTVFRPYMEMTAQSVLRKWPDRASDAVKRQFRDNPYTKIKLLHGVYPREGGKANTFSRTMPYAAVYLEKDSMTVLEESGTNENGYMVSRWSKVANEAWGRGPGWFALPDTKSLNLAKEMELTGWALSIRPPIQRTETGVIGRVRLTPGGETLVRRIDEDIKPLFAAKTDWNATQVKGEQIARSIRELFFRDQLELVENDRMTATEVEQRVQLMQRFLGPTLGRMNSEKLQPLVQNAFIRLYRRGALLPLPPELDTYLRKGGALQIRYEGPLARAQRLSELQAVQRALGAFAAMGQVDPQLAQKGMDALDPDGIADIILDATGVSARGRRDQRGIAQVRAARAQAQQMMNEMQMGSQIAEGMGKAAPMVKALNPAPAEAQAA